MINFQPPDESSSNQSSEYDNEQWDADDVNDLMGEDDNAVVVGGKQ